MYLWAAGLAKSQRDTKYFQWKKENGYLVDSEHSLALYQPICLFALLFRVK